MHAGDKREDKVPLSILARTQCDETVPERLRWQDVGQLFPWRLHGFFFVTWMRERGATSLYCCIEDNSG